MRVLMTTWATASHYLPMVPLGWALRAAGHEVRVACQPSFAEYVAGTGLHPVVIGEDVDAGVFWRGASVDDAPAARSARAVTMFATVGERLADGVTRFAQDWRCDAVVYEPRAYAGLIAAARLGVPAVRHLYGVDYTYARHPDERELLDPVWARLGLTDVRPHGDLTVDPCPPTLQIPGAGNAHAVRHVPYNGPETVPGWLAEPPARRRVCVTWGTTFAKTAGHLDPLRAVLAGVADLDAEVVLAIAKGQRELVEPVPDGVRVVESMPLSLLLPGCSLVVHQGGPGTALAAVAAGVPQVTIPSIGDQPLNTERLEAAGAARGVAFAELSPAVVRAAAAAVLDGPGYAAAAEALRAENAAQPAPATAVDRLLALV
ncbi:nucleotide disphospho-sugar-binding domain-containing protein [Actinomadura rifamycini]|uniref:nucleotide disphospho-sugar-binding domain-containing protein n=1 Tax=Actinomadura rifamycini TaxID=31962 RepID=UPI00040CDBD9|nr:nucleotide disphospho-sugar-binding domain-containing protein [Actinomadura rifamycini]